MVSIGYPPGKPRKVGTLEVVKEVHVYAMCYATTALKR